MLFTALVAACAMTACGTKTTETAAEEEVAREVGSSDIAYVQVEAVLAQCDLFLNEGAALQEKTQKAQKSWAQKEQNLQAEAAQLQEKYQKGLITTNDAQAQQQSIELKNAEVAEKAANVAYNKSMFESRLKGMYEMSRQSNLAILLGIDDVSQMLLFAENLQQISEHDTQLVQQLRDEQAALEAQRAELEQQLADLAAREQELTDTAVAYSNAIQQADAAISAAEADLAANEEALAETQRQYEQAQEEWRQWTAANNVDFEYNQGGFAWPIPGYTNLSSDFGVGRWIYGKWDVHRGMDVPAPAGTKIYAAADGVVSTNNHWTYGISVKISHGSGLATIYGHMSARAVNDGDYVTQGQLIGYVGSTGNSTGNHLHFETTLNGAAVSSRPYLGPPWG